MRPAAAPLQQRHHRRALRPRADRRDRGVGGRQRFPFGPGEPRAERLGHRTRRLRQFVRAEQVGGRVDQVARQPHAARRLERALRALRGHQQRRPARRARAQPRETVRAQAEPQRRVGHVHALGRLQPPRRALRQRERQRTLRPEPRLRAEPEHRRAHAVPARQQRDAPERRRLARVAQEPGLRRRQPRQQRVEAVGAHGMDRARRGGGIGQAIEVARDHPGPLGSTTLSCTRRRAAARPWLRSPRAARRWQGETAGSSR